MLARRVNSPGLHPVPLAIADLQRRDNGLGRFEFNDRNEWRTLNGVWSDSGLHNKQAVPICGRRMIRRMIRRMLCGWGRGLGDHWANQCHSDQCNANTPCDDRYAPPRKKNEPVHGLRFL